MALSERKREQLIAFLGEMPTATAVKLFAAVEADRVAGGDGLPHHEILDDLRERLLARGAALPTRRIDARRLFFTPFEDFFVGERRGRKRPGIIPRTSLAPIWRLMMRETALSEAAFAAASLDDAMKAGRETEDLERALFNAAEAGLARVLDAAMIESGARAHLSDMLGGEAAFADLQELRRLLAGVDHFKQLHRTLPAGVAAFSEDDLYALRTVFLSAHDQSPKLAAFLLLAIKGRLEKPWRALELFYHLSRSADERLEAARDAVAALPEALFDDLESLARSLERDGAVADEFDAQAGRLRISWFAEFADGLADEANRVDDNVSLNRINACRDVAAEAFERFCELALASLRAATPVRQAGGSSFLMAQRPDYGSPPAPRAVDQAREAAHLIADATAFAKRLGAAGDVAAEIAREAREKMTSYAGDLVTEIRAAEGDERKAAERLLENTLSVAEALLDCEEAGLIRDRAKAAAVAV